ncbi:FGGY family carbohydrate kinase [Sphingomonas sp. MMSM20]|uniref:FGGY family carbohydrate kinase n=1 Tax=Sphingomonas lycopersici TaxID=2951807 RepID=UPI002239044E|nr:FGGY family carbohydrate kinase [Sphingomonas lycopersici]MCW6530474.1 FGGY family carbohydrate kinase [Sphingomonas lycopersici]
MPQPAILAIDQGTTNTKALLVSPDGAIRARASRPMTLTHPQPGWSEQSADAIWASVAAAVDELVTGAPDTTIAAVAISNQRETIVLWDAATGRPLAPAISWQCRRSSDRCAVLRAAGHEAMVLERTGLGLDPLFPAAKLAWLLDAIPGARDRAAAGELRAGTVDSWLLWNLTGGTVHATDHGNAARTQLLNLRTLEWDATLLALFGVPRTLLPDLRASDSLFGTVAAGRTALPAGIPIHAVMGDSHAALFGHGIREPGAAKVTIGTGSSIMALTGGPVQSANGLSSTIAWSRGDRAHYALEGNIAVSGHTAAFVARLLGMADEAALSALAETVDDSGGVVVVPALAGLGAPHWQDRARGLIAGMTLGTTPAHIARAAFEAIALQIVDLCRAMEADLGITMPAISVDGGATRNAFLLQLLADLLDRAVERRADPELSALGAARMAAEALGLPARPAAADNLELFVPAMRDDRRQAIHRQWTASILQATPPL